MTSVLRIYAQTDTTLRPFFRRSPRATRLAVLRNALLAGEFGAGDEPLYKLNANIFQLFVSIWF